MTSAIEEFLTENSQRRYPFAEDCGLDASGGGGLTNDVILDLRGWHRGMSVTSPSLLAVVGPEGGAIGSFTATADGFTFYFGSGANEVVWSVFLPVGPPEITMVMSVVADPFYAGVRLGTLRVTFGEGVQSIPADASWSFQSALIEPGLIVCPFRGQVDAIGIIHASSDNEFIGGDIELVGGYNFDVQPTAQGLRLSPSLGGGTLGRFLGSLTQTEDAACAGALLSLAQVVPDAQSRDLKILGKNGIEIINLPEESKIRIKVATQQFGGTICS